MKFLRNLLAAILGSLIAFGIVFVMFFIFVSIAGADSGVVVKKNSILELRLPYPISDYTGNGSEDPFSLFEERRQGLDEVIHAIQVAKDDDDISGISLNGNFLMAGMSQTQAIRNALKDFKDEGKFVYAYGDFFLQKDYYLASVADSLFLNPVGAMDFKGLAAEVLYFKDLQEKTGVKMEVVRHGKYKSAVEPFLDNEMSDANRTQIKELIDALWGSMLADISESRNLSISEINQIADTLGGRTPEYAVSSGLVDGLIYLDQYESKLKTATNLSEVNDLNYISLSDYTERSNGRKVYKGNDRIAVIFAQGEIMYGEGDQDFIGQGIITKALIKAREDDKVKAVVLRVNSPGGNALTSDIIWREIELTKEKKPVVVSMGDVAASGGYYIAVGADKIYAEPTTITGSIGVFGTIPNISELAGNIGINAEQVGTNKNSVDYSLFEPMTDEFREVVQEGIEATYTTFLQRVAEGRNITVAEADSLAQGRVWSGTDAKRLGLIDELGSLDDAIAAAAELAETEAYSIRKYPRYKSGFEKFMEDLEGASVKSAERTVQNQLGSEMYQIFKEVKSAIEQKGIQARMPFTLNIK
ncbi:signal peptide peptidase SppA [Poritiphilus flavus]|uniref:Signal peptide peptidase SppA n=1 Tax=Poritiphilus flavus TaxID=2697053 RepID=A0A6L9EGU7_9FLAO|nr:signal peptide peptidase SppA [Poritiphilus flavus]NAS13903.1 signal peptide peptidase SppA [Poritiphilus flavus]